MMKRVIILGMIACSLLVASTFSVTAVDQISHIDSENDLLDYNFQSVDDNIPDIDIKEVSCEKNGKEITLSLKLVDEGQIQETDEYAYMIALTTDIEEYTALYSQGECEVSDSSFNILEDFDYSIVDGNEFQVTFDLSSSDEDCVSILGTTISPEFFIDICPNEEFLDVDTGGPYTGKPGEPIQFSGSVEGSSSDYEWYWDFGDGEISEEENPTHIYDEPGTYDVSVYVIDEVNANEGVGITTATITTNSGTSNGDDKSDDTGSGLIMFIALIAIIAVAGIAVLIYVIRR